MGSYYHNRYEQGSYMKRERNGYRSEKREKVFKCQECNNIFIESYDCKKCPKCNSKEIKNAR